MSAIEPTSLDASEPNRERGLKTCTSRCGGAAAAAAAPPPSTRDLHRAHMHSRHLGLIRGN
jgi:hypothetical protein